MSNVYITGHRNPDIDSVCSASAYAALKNRIDPDNEYTAVRCGHLSDSVKSMLKALNITPPPYKKDVYAKVGDVMLSCDLYLDKEMPLEEYAHQYSTDNPSATPVFDGDLYYGLLTVDDIARWGMQSLIGEAPKSPLIKEVMTQNAPVVQVTDLFSDVKYLLLGTANKNRGVAVFDKDTYAGYATRRCFLEPPKYNVILVDHNEPEQSIQGIETASILEIIDHHRLDPLKTDVPIYIDSEPIGSTCSIVYKQYLMNGFEPEPDIARILLAGILSDTVTLKSPTTTKTDINFANRLASVCGTTLEDYGKLMYSNIARLKDRDPEQAITADFKTYNEYGTKIGVGQCEVTTLQDLDEYKDRYLDALNSVKEKNGLDWAVLMITDVLKENSVLLTTDYPAVRHLSYQPVDDFTFSLPGVMSRKKQLLPELLHALSVQ